MMIRAPEEITTPRLRGERLGPRHVDVLAPMLADPRVGATMGGVRTPEEVAEQLERFDAGWERDGFGLWMFYATATGEAVGRGGVEPTTFDGRDEVEVAWLVAPEHWSQGFATEVGQAAVDVAFGALGLDNIVAFTLPTNLASRRLMERLGFSYEKTAPYLNYGDHVLYRRFARPRTA